MLESSAGVNTDGDECIFLAVNLAPFVPKTKKNSYRKNDFMLLHVKQTHSFSLSGYIVSVCCLKPSFVDLYMLINSDYFQHWECKLLITLFHYVISANYMWILVEGLHLHTLVYVSVFSERGSIKWYYLIGWGKLTL